MTSILTGLAVYATIGILWAIVSIFTIVDNYKSWEQLTACAAINFIFWPLNLMLYLAKTLTMKE